MLLQLGMKVKLPDQISSFRPFYVYIIASMASENYIIGKLGSFWKAWMKPCQLTSAVFAS